MAHDEYERRFEKCIHCGVYTVWQINGVPVCRSCATEREANRNPPDCNEAGSESVPKK
jgi:hypothetical protein